MLGNLALIKEYKMNFSLIPFKATALKLHSDQLTSCHASYITKTALHASLLSRISWWSVRKISFPRSDHLKNSKSVQSKLIKKIKIIAYKK